MKKNVLFLLFFIISLSYAQLVVNTENDTIDAEDGLTSMREAVMEANETAGQQTITFNETVFLPGANRIIYLKSALELVDDGGVIINGEAGKVTLDGSAIDSTAGNFKNGLVIKAENNEISNLYLQNFLGAAIFIDSLSTGNNTIGPNNLISENGGAGIMIISSENNTITGNNILNCGSDNLEIEGHIIDVQDGVMLLKNANHNMIDANNIWSNHGCGIGAYRCGENTFLNNYLAINQIDGIHLLEDSGGNVIEENQLIGNTGNGIYMYMGSNNTINGNNIGESSVSKISSLNNASSNLLTKTLISQAEDRITDYGMMLYGIKETEITSNTIIGCDMNGIVMRGMMHIDSSGIIPDTSYHFPEGILIESNYLEDNSNSDIHADNTLNITVRENFMQLSYSGFQGQGLTTWDPEVVGRDSVERGDFIIENNIFSNIVSNLKKKAALKISNNGAITIGNLQTASVSNNEIIYSSEGMYYSYITQLAVRSNTVQSVNSYGIRMNMVDSSLVENNHLDNIDANGIEVSNPSPPLTGPLSSSAIIQDNVLSNITGNAVSCTTVTSLDIQRNIISNITQEGIFIYGCNDSNVEGNEISGCSSNSLDVCSSNLVHMMNNRITHPTGSENRSISLTTNQKNILTGNVISDATGYGISITEADTVILIDNEIVSSHFTGCHFVLGTFIQLINNDIHGNSSGINITGYDSIIVQDNTVSGNYSNGLSISNSGNCLVSNNFIIENSNAGLTADNTDSCMVQSNYIADNNYGYSTNAPSGQVLRSNTIQNNSLFGAYNSSMRDSLDARENYWGHANGPATSDTLYPGMEFGDRINEYVIYLPFLTDPTVELLIPPVLTYIEPAESETEGGGSATLHGRHFMPDMQVFFGSDTIEDVQYLSSTILKLTIPPGEGGYVDVIAMNPDGLADTLQNGFYYIPPPVSQDDRKMNMPRQYALHPNYPNPFNPATTIRYDIVHATHVELSIFNIMGQKVATLINKQQSPGRYSVDWNAGEYASGVYFYILRSKQFTRTKKLILLK